MADDMGYECLGAYGSTSYQTPNLDQIASENILVSNCIANPLCTPSRVKIMTGMYNYRNYEKFGYLNPDERTFGHIMQEAGYKTCIVGKWQLNGLSFDMPGNQDLNRPVEMGFGEHCLWQLNKLKNKGERFANPLIIQNGKELPRDLDAYGPDIFSKYALDFIERNADESFFLYYPMVLVHNPFVPTPDSEAWKDPDRRNERNNAYFADMVAYTDKIVGMINSKLIELGIDENTLLIFTGDNGTNTSLVSQLGDLTVKGGKGKTIDYGVHVPLIMKWPAKNKEHITFDGIIDFSDFFATFADIVDDPSPTDGLSFLGLFDEDHFNGEDYAYVYYDPEWGQFSKKRNVFVQNETYKLYQDGSMYNIIEDVNEKQALDSIEIQNLALLRRKMQEILDAGPKMGDPAESGQ